MVKYPDTAFQRWLDASGACYEGRMFVGDQTPQQAWDACQEPTWMGWLVQVIEPSGQLGPQEFRPLLAECGCCYRLPSTVDETRRLVPVLPDFLGIGLATSVEHPLNTIADPSLSVTRPVYHATTPDATWTYLDAERRAEAWRDGEGVVFSESLVTETVYGQLREWLVANYQSKG